MNLFIVLVAVTTNYYLNNRVAGEKFGTAMAENLNHL